MSATPISEVTFLGSDSRLATFVARPIRRFLHIEAAGGLLMLVATVAALVWANSAWSGSYESFWHTPVEFAIGSFHLGGGHHLDLRGIVNDGLMAVFFFVVGLEIKRELAVGQLRTPRAAALPAIAALGGMVVPALVFLMLTSGTESSNGWGIPMATDIAFAVGVVSLLGNRIDKKLRVFLLSLAIVDDLGAIAVIALVYTESISLGWLAASGVIIAAVVVCRIVRVWYTPVYAVFAVLLWITMLQSGIHATVAGVLLGFLTPAHPIQTREQASRWVEWLRDKDDEIMAVDVNYAAFHLRESRSVAERLGISWHPITSFVIVPVFALANAGVPLGGGVLGDALGSKLTWGVGLGLVVGKAVGITLFTWAATRLGLASLPKAMTMQHVFSLAVISGIGFTVSIFVTSLAFESSQLQNQAKVGILAASFLAAVVGLAALARSTRRAPVIASAPTPDTAPSGAAAPPQADRVGILLAGTETASAPVTADATPRHEVSASEQAVLSERD